MKSAVSKTNKTKGNGFYFLITLAALGLAWIINKDISIPSWLTLFVGVVAIFFLFFKGIASPEIPFYALAAYIPFNKILSGTFGGAMTALNLTNILIFITFICLVIRGAGKTDKGVLKAKPFQGQGEAFLKSSRHVKASPLDGPRLSLSESDQSKAFPESIRYAKASPFVSSGFTWLVFLFCFLGIFSVMRGGFYYGSHYMMEFVVPLKRWLTPVFLYFLTLGVIKNRGILKNTVIVIMIVVAVVGLMTVKEGIDLGDSGSLDSSRVGGIAQQPNMMGAFFVYYMFLFLGFFLLNWRKIKNWAILVPFLVCFRGIQVTFSRGALLAFAFGLSAIVFFRNKAIFILFCFFGIFALLNPQWLPGSMRYAIDRTKGAEQVYDNAAFEDTIDQSAATRIEIWKGAFEMIKDNPWWGVGYGVFPYAIAAYVPRIGEIDAHNTYIILAAEMGVFVLAIFLFIIFALFKNTFWLYMRTQDKFVKAVALGVLGGLAGMMIANMFGSRLESEEVSAYFWILAGLIIRAVIMKKKGEIA